MTFLSFLLQGHQNQRQGLRGLVFLDASFAELINRTEFLSILFTISALLALKVFTFKSDIDAYYARKNKKVISLSR